MSDRENILEMSERSRLTADITLLMLKGGGIGLAFVLVIWFVIALIAGIGKALPEQSRETPDPINRSSLSIETADEATFV